MKLRQTSLVFLSSSIVTALLTDQIWCVLRAIGDWFPADDHICRPDVITCEGVVGDPGGGADMLWNPPSDIAHVDEVVPGDPVLKMGVVGGQLTGELAGEGCVTSRGGIMTWGIKPGWEKIAQVTYGWKYLEEMVYIGWKLFDWLEIYTFY